MFVAPNLGVLDTASESGETAPLRSAVKLTDGRVVAVLGVLRTVSRESHVSRGTHGDRLSRCAAVSSSLPEPGPLGKSRAVADSADGHLVFEPVTEYIAYMEYR